MSAPVEIFELEKRDLKGATVVDGFPGTGLIGTIVANFLIDNLHLDQIGVAESTYFPTVTVVRDGVPYNPVRIYAGEQVCRDGKCGQLVVFVSEFAPPAQLARPLVSVLMDWVQLKQCDRIICAEGFHVADNGNEHPEIYAVGSTERAREWIKTDGVKPFLNGTVGGVTGVLLNEGKRRNFDVLGLLAEVRDELPDAQAAARLTQIIDELVLEVDLDPKTLQKQAEILEAQVKLMRIQTPEPTTPAPPSSLYMYG